MTSQKPYPEVEANPDFAAIEKDVIAYWQVSRIFEKSVENRPAMKDGASNAYVFYDGPPFANGLPHYGHLLTGYVKDLVARYHTMKGKRVERRFGWDCHGLPAEMESEKQLGISGRQKIMEFGVGKFNEHCRSSVMRYTQEWRHYVTRQARWVDFDNDYKTMDLPYMESVLWAFKQLFDKGLIYESYRVVPYSWAAETVLSTFETRLDNATREKIDPAVTVAFELTQPPKGAPKADKYFILAWTTTPWTLPSNLALAASKNLSYSCVEQDGVCYIIATSALETYQKELHGLFDSSLTGERLIGLSYKPLFPYFENHQPGKAFKILDGSHFIEEGSGTGIVHMAPAFGEDDQKTCEENGITLVNPVDEKGRFTDEIFDIDGLSLKGENVIEDHAANKKIIKYLQSKNQVIAVDWNFRHNYPHCWRTDKPIIYRAVPSWYVKVTDYKEKARALNQKINWIPGHVRSGTMDHMLGTAPDWSISRNRFWGCPIPVWKSTNPNSKEPIKAFGSIAELEAFFGVKVPDLHRPFIDTLTKPDGEGEYRRVEEVLDCWFESGSMPFAQVHYPFENKDWFDSHFPADFITEYVGQTRGWFNTLIMLSAGIFGKEPFKNCICHGVVLDEETGLKYSKRLKNYKDPMEVFDKFGADALRWMMVASPVMRGADIGVDPEGKFIRDVVRLYIKPIWNAYNFFTLYANADGVKARFSTDSNHLLDRYILAKCRAAVEQIEQSLDAYDTPGACEAVSQFFEVLNNWYIRRSKDRFWKEEQDADKQAAYDTLYTVLCLMCRAGAPLLPLTLEAVYRGLTGEESVHLTDFPDVGAINTEDKLVSDMDRVRDICTAALSIRSSKNIRVRQPLQGLHVCENRDSGALDTKAMQDIIKDEINVKHLVIAEDLDVYADYKLKLNSQVIGKRLPAKMKQLIPASKKGEWEMKDGALVICGEALLPEEYELNLEPRPGVKGAAPLASQDALVVLDLTITPELEAEGIARDMVRMIQEARKKAGLNVSDRIALQLGVPEAYASAVEAHRDYISQQVLAVSLAVGKAGGKHIIESEVEGEQFAIGFDVAA